MEANILCDLCKKYFPWNERHIIHDYSWDLMIDVCNKCYNQLTEKERITNEIM